MSEKMTVEEVMNNYKKDPRVSPLEVDGIPSGHAYIFTTSDSKHKMFMALYASDVTPTTPKGVGGVYAPNIDMLVKLYNKNA